MKEESGDHQPARQDTAEDKRQDWPHPADDLQSVYGVFDHAPFALAALKGEDLVIEYINEYNLEIWQKTRQQVLGRPLWCSCPLILCRCRQWTDCLKGYRSCL